MNKPKTFAKIILILYLTLFAVCGCATRDTKDYSEIASYKTKNPEGMAEVFSFIKSCDNYFIATMDGVQPRIRPFATLHIYDGKMYILTSSAKRVSEQIEKNPHVALCAYNGKEWVRVATILVEDPRIEAKKAVLDGQSDLRSMYNENDSKTKVYALTDAVARFSSFDRPDREIHF